MQSTSSLNGEESSHNPFHTIVNEKSRSNDRSILGKIKSKTMKKQISEPSKYQVLSWSVPYSNGSDKLIAFS